MNPIRSDWRLAVFGVAAVIALPLVLTPPRGDHPIDDDVDYSATAFHLAKTGEWGVTDWPSMTLVAHAAWGAGFSRLFGATHESLRVSTIVLAAAAAAALAIVAWRSKRSAVDSTALAAWYFLNPLSLSLSFTFMTDQPAAALTVVGLAAACRPAGSFATGLLGAWGLLIRQTGVVWAAASVGESLWRRRGRRRIQSVLAAAVPIVLAWIAWRLWQATHGGPPWNAVRMHLTYVAFQNPKLLIAKSLCLALGCSLHLLPIALLRVHPADFVRRRFLFAALILGVALIGARDHLRVHEGTDVRDVALGGAARVSGEAALRSPTFAGSTVFEWIVVPLGIVGLFTLLAIALRASDGCADLYTRSLSRIAAATFAATFALYLCVESIFDRYYLALLAPASIWLAVQPARAVSARLQATGLLLTFVYVAAGLAGLEDSQRRAEVVWRTARTLVAEGVPPDEINACFEFTAEHLWLSQYWSAGSAARPQLAAMTEEERTRRLPDKMIFVAARKWTLSWKPLPGYQIDREIPWRSSWRRGTLFVLRKQPSEPL